MSVTGKATVEDLAVGGTTELVYESSRTMVFRSSPVEGGSVVYKKPIGPNAARRLRHERAILERLVDVPGVVRLVEGAPSSEMIALEDLGGDSLAVTSSSGPMAVEELVRTAFELTKVLAAVHGAGVIHRDVTPANIIWSEERSSLFLIDFDLATAAVEESPAFAHQNTIAGTLAYLAPEQTGRTGWPIDQRSDLYGLGAVLYELATGQPPFGFGDSLRLVHDHLALVPEAPIQRDPTLPPALSAIIMRLLEKEPDLRYQSAEGLAHDLGLLRDHGRELGSSLVLGTRDFPSRLSAPSRLVGREAEVEALAGALSEAVAGHRRAVLVTGGAGVGKSALLDQMRSIVSHHGGWFVRGKFDQYRQDFENDAARQAMSELVRLLLAEPEEEIGQHKARLLRYLGPNASLLAALMPELASLLGVVPHPPQGDPLAIRARVRQSELALLRAIASRQRPVVVVLDSLQWALPTPLELVDTILTEPELDGVLVVGAYRDAEIGEDHPLAALLARWDRLDVPVERLPLANLPADAVATMLGDMLRLTAEEVSPLAAAITARTGGNPYETVELVNSLRRDGTLVPTADGWRWAPEMAQSPPEPSDVVALLAGRIRALPARTLGLLEVMCCLGGSVDHELLSDASGLSPEEIEHSLLPALREGLIVTDHPDGQLRFRHDRVQQAALDRLTSQRLTELRLQLAHRLAALPNRQILAAEQYLPAIEAVEYPTERRTLVSLFRAAATEARSVANHARAERFLAAATALLSASGLTTAVTRIAVEIATERHAALYGLGRLDEASETYRRITELTDDPLLTAAAAPLQISVLASQNRPAEAVELALDLLRRLGTTVPEDPATLRRETELGMDAVYQWVAAGSVADDLRRPDCDDHRILTIGTIIDRAIPPAFASEFEGTPWLVTTAARMWAEYGPARALVGPLSNVALFAGGLREDYRTGHTVMRRVLAASEARGYEPETSHALSLYALTCAPWFEPLETVIDLAHQAHDGLVRGGEANFAAHTYFSSLFCLFDRAASVDELAAEAEAALAFAARTGNDEAATLYVAYRQAARSLRGHTRKLGGLSDDSFDEEAHLASIAGNHAVSAVNHTVHASVALIFGDTESLVRHSTAAAKLLKALRGTYGASSIHLLHALAIASQIRQAEPADREALLASFDAEGDWFSARAADSPGGFGHLLSWLEAERAWSVGEFKRVLTAFDTAIRAAGKRHRPWHQALVAERAAMFHLEHGLEHAGHALLVEARSAYQRWGATAKVHDLDRRHPTLRPIAGEPPLPTEGASGGQPAFEAVPEATTGARHASLVSVENIDLLGLLDASQALSSETNLERLRIRVKSVLKAMTGATDVQVALWDDDAEGWFLSATDGDSIPITQAATRGLLPLWAFRYVERTEEPLVVADATKDERFSKDPYFAGLARCSLLVVPILSRGAPRAMLFLENRLSRNAFAGDRLETVMLIAGQLTVSLDNALLYASLERKVSERTEALAIANQRLETLSVTDALTGLANRRRLAEVLDLEWQRALRPATPLAVAMIDIDYFKLYNDHYGHPAGDQCLRRVAGVLNERVRATDLVARYGGEEFAVVMPGANLVVAKRISDRIRESVIMLEQAHERSPIGIVTISVGVAATVPSCAGLPEQLIELADHRLYRAKNAGRNQVVAD